MIRNGDDERESMLAQSADENERERLRELWRRLDLLDDDPPPGMIDRFSAVIRGAHAVSRQTGGRIGLTAASLVAGLLIGVALTLLVSPPPGPDRTVEALEAELRDAHRRLAEAIRPGSTATTRLSAVVAIGGAAERDNRLRDTLVTLAERDPNLNVRMVAAEELAPYLGDAELSASLVKALETSDEPMMKVVLIDLLVHGKVRSASPVIERLVSDESEDPLVKDKAGWAVQALGGRRDET